MSKAKLFYLALILRPFYGLAVLDLRLNTWLHCLSIIFSWCCRFVRTSFAIVSSIAKLCSYDFSKVVLKKNIFIFALYLKDKQNTYFWALPKIMTETI